MPPQPIPLSLKLERGAPHRPTDGCWEWQRGRHHFGYGELTHRQRHISAHRASWIVANGPIPIGMNVLHSCDNPPCIRPDHLFLGTHADNVADREAKGRGNWSGLHPMARKLTWEKVCAIRARRGTATLAALGREFGVSYQMIALILDGRAWLNDHQ